MDHMEGAAEVASGIVQEHVEYRAITEAVHSATEMVSMACELKAYGAPEGDELIEACA